MAITPKVVTESEPISEVTKITNPVGQKNVAGAQVNPATEDSLALAKTAVEAINTALQVAGITQAQLAAIQAAVQSAPYKGTAPTHYNVTMTNANTEYSQALSANTKKFSLHTRDFSAFRFAYVTGKVAGPVAPYLTIPAGGEKVEELIQPAAITLYFASSDVGKIIEIEEWV